MSKKFILIGITIILIITGCTPDSGEPVTTPIIVTLTSEVDPISDTPTAPVNTPTQSPSPTAEPTPIAEPTPTPSAEQIEQSIMDQFVSGPLYDQFIADNQIPEQAATAFYNEYPGADGKPFAVVTMKVDPNILSEEQKAINIPQRDYLVVKTTDGQIEFKLLPVNLQLETFSQSAVEFTLSKEYQQGLQDYLNAMGLEAGAVTIAQTQKEINRQQFDFIEVEPNKQKLTELQKKYSMLFGTLPLAYQDEAGVWFLVSPRFIDELTGKTKHGVQLDFYDYNNLQLNDLASILWSSPFSRIWVETNGNGQINRLMKLVSENNQILFIHPGLWHLDLDSTSKLIDSKESASQYLEFISDDYMNWAQQALKKTLRQ